MKGLIFNHASQILHVALFIPNSIDGVKSTIFSLFCDGNLSQFQKIRLRHHIGVKSTCVQSHIDHTCFNGITDFEGGDRFGST